MGADCCRAVATMDPDPLTPCQSPLIVVDCAMNIFLPAIQRPLLLREDPAFKSAHLLSAAQKNQIHSQISRIIAATKSARKKEAWQEAIANNVANTLLIELKSQYPALGFAVLWPVHQKDKNYVGYDKKGRSHRPQVIATWMYVRVYSMNGASNQQCPFGHGEKVHAAVVIKDSRKSDNDPNKYAVSFFKNMGLLPQAPYLQGH